MSADNGIYILKMKDQYRVIYAHAIENLYWSYLNQDTKRDFVSTRIVESYGGTRYTRNLDKAYEVASAMARRYTYLEYGIQILSIDKTWKQIVKEAKKLAPLEMASLSEYNTSGRWDWELKRLEQVLVTS